MKIKVVILHHNRPDGAERLLRQLSGIFDDVEVWDSGSDPDKMPKCQHLKFPNLYWTGAWNKLMLRHSDYDIVWMLGDDLTLASANWTYRVSMESAMPFGCWSPCINGRAHPFMALKPYSGRPKSVKNVEGMAMACSGALMREVKRLIDGSPIGYGQDFWFCHKARKMGLRNVIDGRVVLQHPPSRGYDDQEALAQMDRAFGSRFGGNYRQTIFEYAETYNGNLIGDLGVADEKKEDTRMFKIVTVDNGWGVPEFCRIARQIDGATRVIMRKGISRLEVEKGIEIIDYEDSLAPILDADVALFTRVGAANKEEFKRLMQAGIPCIVNAAFHQGAIQHEKNGFIYGVDEWALKWLRALKGSDELRKKISNAAKGVEAALSAPPVVDLSKVKAVSQDEPVSIPAVKPAKPAKEHSGPMVTVITPTRKRHPAVVRRCIDCMLLQTMNNWEQLICSDGEEEPAIRDLVASVGDPRIIYHHTDTRTDNDYGNTVRKTMIEKARGRYIAFCDDDNVILPVYFEKMVKAIQNSGKDFAVCRVMHFGPLNESVLGKPPVVLDGSVVKLYHVDPLQFLVWAEAMKDIGWDTAHGYVSDGHTLEALGKKYSCVCVDDVLGVHM